jgi:hypothetical protein
MLAPLVLVTAALTSPRAEAPGRAAAPRQEQSTFDSGKAGFSIEYNGEAASYRDLSTFVLRGTTLRVEVAGPPGRYTLRADGAAATAVAPTRGTRAWQWVAPQAPGVYDVRVEGPVSGSTSSRDAITLHVFVMVPAGQVRDGFLNGYEIGGYPQQRPGGKAMYQPPMGFVEVTRANQDVRVSPHFQLKQFLCKQETSRPFPQYLVLKERLVLELEAILERINLRGFHVDGLHVMSGYRTPFYNHAIGDILYSQHQWGAAADIYVDSDNRNRMDDLNHDGRIDVNDAKYLFDMIEQMLADPSYAKFSGGMGFYQGTSAHPPFVHVDVRGSTARWRG